MNSAAVGLLILASTLTAPALPAERTAAAISAASTSAEALRDTAPALHARRAANRLLLGAGGGRVVAWPGMRHLVLHAGPASGPRPSRTSVVKVRYEGSFPSGELFVTTRLNRDGAQIFDVNAVIVGMSAALQSMHAGDRWRVFIPSQLAYPPGMPHELAGKDLVFDLELVAFTTPPPAPPRFYPELPG